MQHIVRNVAAALLVTSALAGLAGCEAIATFNRSKIPGAIRSDAGAVSDASMDAMPAGDAAMSKDGGKLPVDASRDTGVIIDEDACGLCVLPDAGHDAAVSDDAGSDAGAADGG